MKHYLSIFSCILMFLVSSCKDDIIEYSNDQESITRAGVGEIIATPSETDFIENKAHSNYEIECTGAGVYYLSAWMEIPIINEELPKYQIKINGILNEKTFKPKQAGFQYLILTDNNNEPVPVALTKGKNIITLVSIGREILNVEELKASANLKDARIDDSEYQSYLGKLSENPVSRSASHSTTLTQSDQIYDYVLNLPSTHTYTQTIYLEDFQKVKITTTSNNFPHVIELYNNYYKFSAYGTSSATLDIVTPDYWGNYTLRIRALEPGTNGLVSFNYREEWSGMVTSRDYVDVVAGGNTVPVNRTLSDYYILSHSSIGLLYNDLTLIDSENKPLSIGSYKRVFPNANSVGEATDPYTYFEHAAFLNHSGVKKCHVTSLYSRYPSSTVDIYMGLGLANSNFLSYFPKAPKNNTFMSGPRTTIYNCISWTIERTDYWEWPGDYGSSYYHSNLLTAFDKLYSAYGYTRSGATADNAGIALWATSNQVSSITHASVTKNANTTKPHGFDWESKCGSLERVMHERNALVESSYGAIHYYYRPTSSNSKGSIASQEIAESINLSSVNTLISTLKAEIPSVMTSEFENKYTAWKKTWNNPEIVIHSNPRKYAESKEYAELLKLCQTYDKASWPLFIEKLTNGDILAVNLVKDLTISDNRSLMEEVKTTTIKNRAANTPLPSMYSNYINYCTKLLSSNNTGIENAITKNYK